MSQIQAYAAHAKEGGLKPFEFARRPLKPHSVRIKVHFCGICHSDIHQVRNEWGGARYPMVPGHEIAGTVVEAGAEAKKFSLGAKVGVGCFVDSCRRCDNCRAGFEQFCAEGMTPTYNGVERGSDTPTFGGYSQELVVDEDYVLRLGADTPLDRAAPLLCAGITTYSPLKHWGAGPGRQVGIIGMGGLGHMGVKIAVAMGATVTVISQSRKKEADARKMGAQAFVATGEQPGLTNLTKRFDLLLNTVSEVTDLNAQLGLLRRDGVMAMVGLPAEPAKLKIGAIISQRRSLTGSNIGGIAETQEMLDFCHKHGILCDTETIAPADINAAYDRVVKSDVRYRFVIDASKFGGNAATP